jgi:hypothetical protein
MQAVIEFRTGDPNGLNKILKTWFWRSVVLSAGLYIFSDKKTAVKNGVISASIIEAYLLYYFNRERSKRYLEKMQGSSSHTKQIAYMPSTAMPAGFPQQMVSTPHSTL